MSVVTASTFSAANLKIDSTKKQLDSSPAAIVYLNYNGGRLRVQTPRLTVPFNAGDFQGNGKFKVNLDLKNRTTDPKVKAYYDMLSAIDKAVVQQGVKSSANWLGLKGVGEETINALYTKSVRVSKDKNGKDREPIQSIAIKKNYKTGEFDTALYDKQNRKIEGKNPLEVLRRGAQVTCILDATSIWVAGGKFGISWKLVQVRVDVDAENGDAEPAFVDEAVDGEESAPTENLMVQDDSAEAEEEQQEEEEEEEEVVEPVPAPAPAPAPAAKKTAVKKVTK